MSHVLNGVSTWHTAASLRFEFNELTLCFRPNEEVPNCKNNAFDYFQPNQNIEPNPFVFKKSQLFYAILAHFVVCDFYLERTHKDNA